MSERKPGTVILPVPQPLETPHHQSFTLGGQNRSLEESFENFSFVTNALSSQQQQEQQQQNNSENLQLQPLPIVNATLPQISKGRRQTKTRNYKLYAGNSIFFCGGRFLTSRALWAFCLSLFLLFGPCILFLIFT